MAKAASRSVSAQMEEFLAPLQPGHATSKGTEAAVHSARMYLRDLPTNYAMVKLDFRNTFNSVRRDRVLEATLEHIPEPIRFSLCNYLEINLHETAVICTTLHMHMHVHSNIIHNICTYT